MNRLPLVLLVSIVAVGCGHTDTPTGRVPGLPAPLVEQLTKVPFLDVKMVENIPGGLLSQILPDSSGGMASPGQRFQATDALESPALPWTRLVFAAKSPELWVIAFEHGGYGPHDHVVIMKVEGASWHPVFAWKGDLAETRTSANPFLHSVDKILKGTMRNQLDHWETIHQ